MPLPARQAIAALSGLTVVVLACLACPTPTTPPTVDDETVATADAETPRSGVLLLHDAFRLTDVEPTHVKIGNDRRPAVLLPPNTLRATTTSVPAGQPILRLSYGLADAAGEMCRTPLRFVVRATTDGPAPTTLIDERVDPHVQRWFDSQADLTRWEGDEVTLQVTFESEESGGGSCPVPLGTVGDARIVYGDDEARAEDSRPDLWIVLVDALRTDHVGYMGSTITATRHMDRLASESVRFDRAHAGSPWTLESVLMMTSGTYLTAAVAGPRGPSDLRIPPHVPSAVDRLRDAGYRTLSLYANEMMAPGSGFERSFASHSFIGTDEELPGRLQALLEGGDPREPRLVYLHLISPHMPYVYRRGITDVHLRRAGLPDRGPEAFTDWHHLTQEDVSEEKQQLVSLYYRGEVEVADAVVGDLVDVIDDQERDGGRPTWVFFTSDHGEELWDHGGFEHGHTMYQELLHVPLAVRPPLEHPLRAGGRDVTQGVSLLDVGHTLVELADAAPLEPPNGRSLTPWFAPEPPALDHPRTLLAMGVIYDEPKVAIIRGDHKQIRTQGLQPAFEQYDLATDPGEQDPDDAMTDAWNRFDEEWATLQQLAVSATLTLRVWLRPGPSGDVTLRICPPGDVLLKQVSPAAAPLSFEPGEGGDPCTTMRIGGTAPVSVDLQLTGLREGGPQPVVSLLSGEQPIEGDRVRWPEGSMPVDGGRAIPLPWEHHAPYPWSEALPDDHGAIVDWAPLAHAVPLAVELPDPLKERLRALGYYER